METIILGTALKPRFASNTTLDYSLGAPSRYFKGFLHYARWPLWSPKQEGRRDTNKSLIVGDKYVLQFAKIR